MGRRAKETVVQSGVHIENTQPSESLSVKEADLKITPATHRLLPLFKKIDQKNYFTIEEYDRICLIVAGDKRRAIQRLILGIYQRAQKAKDGDEAHRARFLIALHEAEKLEENL